MTICLSFSQPPGVYTHRYTVYSCRRPVVVSICIAAVCLAPCSQGPHQGVAFEHCTTEDQELPGAFFILAEFELSAIGLELTCLGCSRTDRDCRTAELQKALAVCLCVRARKKLHLVCWKTEQTGAAAAAPKPCRGPRSAQEH